MGLIVQVNEDCSYSPRKEFIRDLNVAFAEGDIDFIKKHADENIIWEFVGSWTIEGKAKFLEELENLKNSGVQKLYLDCIITYEDRASCNGIIFMENGNQYSFADVFRFTGDEGDQLLRITSYMIETTPKSE
jgi:hypothetical protein